MRKLLLTATILVATGPLACAQITPSSVPPSGYTPDAAHDRFRFANPENSPITGASIRDVPYGAGAPPSLELLMSLRPGIDPKSKLAPARAEELREAALSYGAAGGLSAFAFANNENLRRREAELDRTFDSRFRELILPVAGEQTLIVPPAISEEQMAFARGDSGRVARETNRIYRISRDASLSSQPPTWRSFLVQVWPDPAPPDDKQRPHNDAEAKWFRQCVAEGWAQGWKQGDEVFLDRLARLQSDIVGMARYRILLRAGLVEQPRVAILRAAANGRGDMVRYGDTVTRITGGASLTGGAVRQPQHMPAGPIGPIPGPEVQP
ncbi:MAG: type IV secretory system conjugative DNA transfer family protein [Rhodopila sp.]|jgi:defect-in-organelle-trafficking protein DotC